MPNFNKCGNWPGDFLSGDYVIYKYKNKNHVYSERAAWVAQADPRDVPAEYVPIYLYGAKSGQLPFSVPAKKLRRTSPIPF